MVSFCELFYFPAARDRGYWIFELCTVLDVPFDVALALLCAGLIGPEGDRAGELVMVARLAARRCFHVYCLDGSLHIVYYQKVGYGF